MADDKFFPQIRKGLEDFMNEEEGNILCACSVAVYLKFHIGVPRLCS